MPDPRPVEFADGRRERRLTDVAHDRAWPQGIRTDLNAVTNTGARLRFRSQSLSHGTTNTRRSFAPDDGGSLERDTVVEVVSLVRFAWPARGTLPSYHAFRRRYPKSMTTSERYDLQAIDRSKTGDSSEEVGRWTYPIHGRSRTEGTFGESARVNAITALRLHLRASDGDGHGRRHGYPAGVDPTALVERVTCVGGRP